ncbi:MAG: transketolase [Chitinophagales bacterium]|nr:transketolase [Chitinophagales bacterium]
MSSTTEYKSLAKQVRRDIVRMVHAVQSGHPGGSLGCVEFFIALYFDIMKNNPAFDMNAKGEDVFFLSNGHISPVFYSVLARRGYFEVSELNTFRKLNTRLQGHPTTAEHLPGVRMASGSLGQGLSVACGAALTKKMNGENTLVFSLHGDGELQEGQIWEAAMFAAHKKIDNLIATVDVNRQQIDGPVNEILSLGNLRAKWESFGWEVLDMEGNDIDDVIKVMNQAKSLTGRGKPICILMKTEMGKGVDFMEGTHKWHGSPPNNDQLAAALAQLEETKGDY